MSASVDKRPCSALGHFGPIEWITVPREDNCSGKGPFQKQLFLSLPRIIEIRETVQSVLD
jgi:hypothetical protein